MTKTVSTSFIVERLLGRCSILFKSRFQQKLHFRVRLPIWDPRVLVLCLVLLLLYLLTFFLVYLHEIISANFDCHDHYS